ncbi:sulfatase [Planctomicrobium sp. SH664]|uniref:sulfatase n=1 Tax=Planctomicrobium sp. SH664 TaxID=3448125 RepID=UPI003F5C2701
MLRFSVRAWGLVALAGLLMVTGRSDAAEKQSPPNIVVFLVDDMGIMDTSLPFLTDESGKPKRYPLNDYYRTPNMERLAAQGIRFNQFSAMSVCSPSRVSIMTGQTSARHHTTNWIHSGVNNVTKNGPPDWNWEGLSREDLTLAKLLQSNGFRTIHVGKAHFGPGEAGEPQQIGFDVNIAGGGMGRPASYLSEQHYGNKRKGKNNKLDPNAVPGMEKYYDSGLFLTEALTLEANAQVADAAQAHKPFFLYFSHYAVHGPFNADPRFIDHYPKHPELPNAGNFAALIEGMDKSLGDLLDQLDKSGIADNTLVFFLGDNGSDAPRNDEHGYSSSAPFRGKKGTHYEGGMRVPFIAAWAKRNPANPNQQKLSIPAGAIQTQMASVCDLFPTIAAIAGIKPVESQVVDGRNMSTLLEGKQDPSHPQTFLMHFPHHHRSTHFTSYRDGKWKVIYHYFPSELSEGGHYQLYDLEADPWEEKNLAASHPAELRRMMQALIAALEEAGAQYPVDADSGQAIKPQLP